MTVDDDLDRLYGADPADFTGLRAELVAAAKKRGDTEEARSIAAARKPTTAAWVVNALVLGGAAPRRRLGDLAERLRDAHASMDGARIRELSSAQRKLVDDLVREGFTAARVAQPSAALRDDVVGTLQAAIADPEVAARLGRLAKAERWSGFGEFGAVDVVGAVAKPKKSTSPERPKVPESREAEVAAARARVAAARAVLATAEEASFAAADVLTERTAELATARRRYETLLESASAAERDLGAADADLAVAAAADQHAADREESAKVSLREAELALAAVFEREA